jgi:ribosome-interacting GTPase 1
MCFIRPIRDPFRLDLPAVLVANKCDLDPGAGEVDVLQELGPFLFRALEIVRVYTKSPGKPADRDRPFTVRRGDTVADVARLVHREIAKDLKLARTWGKSVYDGQQTGPEHLLEDGDVVELHF